MNSTQAPRTPSNAAEARALLSELMSQLRRNLTQDSSLPLDLDSQAPRLLKDDWDDLWDSVRLLAADGRSRETRQWPHLTLAMQPKYVNLQLTLPNGAPNAVWTRLRHADQTQWLEALTQVESGMSGLGAFNCVPELWLELRQRHFYAQRFVHEDGLFSVKVEALTERGDEGVKPVSAWLPALQALLRSRGEANFQFQVQARFDFADGSSDDLPAFAALLALAAERFAPLYVLMTGEQPRSAAA